MTLKIKYQIITTLNQDMMMLLILKVKIVKKLKLLVEPLN